MAKKAVLIGINYLGTESELNGCINDAWRMHDCLIKRFGFSKDDITVLVDNDDSYTQPTGKNIKLAITSLISSAKPGDILFVHYSGHGVRLPAETGEEDDTGYDECIVPCDMNLITDDDFKDFVDKLPKDCKLTIVSDSCHSGGLIEETKEQIGESTTEGECEQEKADHAMQGRWIGDPVPRKLKAHNRNIKPPPFRRSLDLSDPDDPIPDELKDHQTDVEPVVKSRGLIDPVPDDLKHHHRVVKVKATCVVVKPTHVTTDFKLLKKRSLPLSTLIDILKKKTGKDDIDVGKLRATLFDVFGEDASPKVKKFMNHVYTKLKCDGGNMGKVGGLAQEFLKQKLNEKDEGYVKAALETRVESKHEVYAGSTRSHPDGGILMSGCQSDQDSADIDPSEESKSYGAFSNAIQAIIEETDGVVTNSELVTKAGEMLEKQDFAQKPGLYCSDQYVNAPFLR